MIISVDTLCGFAPLAFTYVLRGHSVWTHFLFIERFGYKVHAVALTENSNAN